MLQRVYGRPQGLAQPARAGGIMLQQVVGHTARRPDPYTRQAAQSLDQCTQRLGFGQTGFHHQNGSFIPGGSDMPAVTSAIFSWEVASALRRASLNAAATRSSTISRSSSNRLGSMTTRLTSCLQQIGR